MEMVSKLNMGGFWPAASTMLVIVIPAVAADPVKWGPTIDRLKMSIAITRIADADAELQITVKNASNEPILIEFGRILNPRLTVLSLRAFVTMPDGTERTVNPGPARIHGSFAIRPLSVELIPNASYIIAGPLVEWKDWSGPTDLKALLSQRSQLTVELDTTKTECPLRPCWRGKLVSNVLQFRQ